ncbi:MAG TPA: TadE/TadG family type IV pilus assembly protein [Stellaceae bacterium]|nr:TadE/TadG family type IV pilus assembly protein [Stellaceae bacterium]
MKSLRRLACDDRGQVAILFGLLVIVLAAVVGAGLDYGRAVQIRAGLQNAVDSAAIAGVNVYTAPSAKSSAEALAQNYVAKGTDALPPKVTVVSTTVTSGTTGSGNNTAYTMYASVTASVPTTFLSFYQKTMTVTASATATRTPPKGTACILALNASAAAAVSLAGSTSVGMSNCGVAVNSSSSDGLDLKGNASLSVQSATLVGNAYSASGNALLTVTNGVKYNQPTVADPYAAYTIPAFSGCKSTNYATSSTVTLQPGVYCGGIATTAQAIVTLSPGVYFLDGGGLSMTGGSIIAGTGVTIILTSSGAARSIGSFDVAGTTGLQITAPTTGPTAGIALWVDRRAPLDSGNTLTGSIGIEVTGAIYAPSQSIDFGGGEFATGCTQLIADKISFQGDSTFNNSCADTGISPIVTSGGTVLLTQ